MGGSYFLMSCSALVQKLHSKEYQLEDKSWVTDTCEEILSRVHSQICFKGTNRRSIVAAGGVDALLKVLRMSEDDEDLVSIIFSILSELIDIESTTDKIFTGEGDNLIERLFVIHESHHSIRADGRRLISHFNRYGSDVALAETRKIKQALEHNIPLDAINMIGSEPKNISVRGKDAMKRLIISMKKYINSEKLVQEALDTILLFVTKHIDTEEFFEINGGEALIDIHHVLFL
mmetsp:Transcript_29865/g.44043  ORF Transcript_29865/g.44043 Transcript_29865/m.44043 type:complete len:233 (-) Transcript_29865:313-1011(-)